MTGCNSMPRGQADSDQQVPARVTKTDAIETLGQAPEQFVPSCTQDEQSSVRSHSAARWPHTAMTAGARCIRWPLALAAGGLVALGWATLGTLSPQVVYNASDSVPAGWYGISSAGSLAVGDLVLVHLPAHAATLAAQRGYLPTQVPLLKTVAAIPPQNICVRGDQVLVDEKVIVTRLHQDRQGRALPAWQACRRLVGDELLLLSTANPESFDSRYFGPVSASAVVGRAQPLWLESRR